MGIRAAGWTRRAMLAAPSLMATGAAGATVERSAVSIPGAWTRELSSAEGLAYRLFLWVPPGPPPPSGFAVTYLVDGNAVFGTAVDIARLAAEGFGPKRPGTGAIVAIGYPGERPLDPVRRTFDLTPPPAAAALPPRPNGEPWPRSGGADRFLDFIEQELKPLVSRELPVDTGREALFGHSFGGLFALHCLFTRPSAFSTYVAASPSIWWNGGAVLEAERAFAACGRPGRPTRLLLMAGSQEGGPPVAAAAPHERRRQEARIVDNAREMSERLAGTPDLSVRFHLFEGEDHGSVIPAALARGLRFATDAGASEDSK